MYRQRIPFLLSLVASVLISSAEAHAIDKQLDVGRITSRTVDRESRIPLAAISSKSFGTKDKIGGVDRTVGEAVPGVSEKAAGYQRVGPTILKTLQDQASETSRYSLFPIQTGASSLRRVS